MNFHKSVSSRGNSCLRDVRHLEIRFTSPLTTPQLNSISIVSKKEGASLRKVSFLPEFTLPFLFLSAPPIPTNLMPSLKLVRIGVMHDGRLLREKSFWLTTGFKSTSPVCNPSYDVAKTQTKWKSTFNFLLITSINFPPARQLRVSSIVLSNFRINNLTCWFTFAISKYSFLFVREYPFVRLMNKHNC